MSHIRDTALNKVLGHIVRVENHLLRNVNAQVYFKTEYKLHANVYPAFCHTDTNLRWISPDFEKQKQYFISNRVDYKTYTWNVTLIPWFVH